MHNIKSKEPITGEWLESIGMVRVNTFQTLYRHVRSREHDESIDASKLEIYLWPRKEGGWVFGPVSCDYRKPIHTQSEFWHLLHSHGFAVAIQLDANKWPTKVHPFQASLATLAV